jgi:HEAT repeat protein
MAGLSDARMASALRLTSYMGIPLEQKLESIADVLNRGSVIARRSAAEALAQLPGNDANQLVLRCLEDDDVGVQLGAIKQLRSRGIPDALALLARRLNHSDDRIRQAARDAMADLSFERYLATFEDMDEATRRKTGAVILHIDPNALETLRGHLEGKFRHHRVRAARAARVLDLVDQIRPTLLLLLADEDPFVRREAIESLALCADAGLIDQLYEIATTPRHELGVGAAEALEHLRRIARSREIQAAAQVAAEKLGLTRK